MAKGKPVEALTSTTHMKQLIKLVSLLSLVCCSFGAGLAKPRLTVAADGFPGGRETPEGVACDLARAFTKHDVQLFTNTCLKPFGGGTSRTDYQTFLTRVEQGMQAEAAQKEPSPGGPKAIGKVYAARHLSLGGPASYGYASFGFLDVMFVDVGAVLNDGRRVLNRTLVIKTKSGAWQVHPAPGIHPLLSAGLNAEPASTADFATAYEVQK